MTKYILMNRYFLFLVLVIIFFSCNAKRNDKVVDDLSKQTTTVEVIDTSYNFGTIKEGEKVQYSYRFKNTGRYPLVINDATASCGCTVPEKPDKPILSGDTGFIKVVFDSKGKSNHVVKTITITSNANPPFRELLLNGDVIKSDH